MVATMPADDVGALLSALPVRNQQRRRLQSAHLRASTRFRGSSSLDDRTCVLHQNSSHHQDSPLAFRSLALSFRFPFYQCMLTNFIYPFSIDAYKIYQQQNPAAALSLPASIWRAPGAMVADAAASLWMPRLLELIRSCSSSSGSGGSAVSPEVEAALYLAARNAVVR